MSSKHGLIKRLHLQRGASSIEYALLAGTIGFMVLMGASAVAVQNGSMFDDLIEKFPTAAGSSSGAGYGAGNGSAKTNASGALKVASLDNNSTSKISNADKIQGTYRVSTRYTCTPAAGSAGQQSRADASIETTRPIVSELSYTMHIDPDKKTITSVAPKQGATKSAGAGNNYQASADFKIDSKHDVLVVSDEVVEFDGVASGLAQISARNNGVVYRLRSTDQGDSISRISQARFTIAPQTTKASADSGKPLAEQALLCDIQETGIRVSMNH